MANLLRKQSACFCRTLAFAALLAALGPAAPARAQHVGRGGSPDRAAAGRATAAARQASPASAIRNWNPAEIYAILNSADAPARESLYRAAFAEGSAIVPELQAALQDDRTAEFAAQELAFIGGARAHAILANLVHDPRDLDLRRFYYGALGGSDDPNRTEILLDKIRASDGEPDRTVTQSAILALSISSDPSLVAKLEQAAQSVTDPVVQDDIHTAMSVIDLRAKYLASAAGKDAGGSVRQAIRTYFMPSLAAPPEERGTAAGEAPQVQINIKSIAYSPDKMRALAAVDFDTPEAVAFYWMVAQKKAAGWTMASVWLGEEREKTPPPASPAPPAPRPPQ